MDHKKISYEPRAYVSVDKKYLSLVMSRKNKTKKELGRNVKGNENLYICLTLILPSVTI